MIWRTRFSSLAVSTRPQNETISSKCPALQQWRRDPEAARSRVEHRGAKVQRNLTRRLYRANGQSPVAGESACPTLPCKLLSLRGGAGAFACHRNVRNPPGLDFHRRWAHSFI